MSFICNIQYFKTENTLKMPEEKIEIINIRLPDKIISMLDSLVDEGLFNSRSEAVREFSRQYIEEES